MPKSATQGQSVEFPLRTRAILDPVPHTFSELHQKLIAAGFRPMGDGAMSDSYIYDCSSEKPEMEAIKELTEAIQMPQEIIPEDACPPTSLSAHITSALNYAQELLGSGRKISAYIDELYAGSEPRLIVTEHNETTGGSLSFGMPLAFVFHFHARGLGEYFLEQLGRAAALWGRCETDTDGDGDCHLCVGHPERCPRNFTPMNQGATDGTASHAPGV